MKIFNFGLTVLTGISDSRLCLGFGVHSSCEGVGDVVGVVTPLGGVAQVGFRGVKVVEVGGEGQVEVEREEGEVKERRSCMKMG